MDSIDILTGQHVTIKYEPASIVQRMFAVLLDYVFKIAYLIAITYIFIWWLSDIFDFKENNIIFFIFYAILLLPALLYSVFFETLLSGQTPGKIILKIRVTQTDGSTPGFVSYFLRWLLLPIDMLPYGGVGALLIIFTKNHQRLGDLAAGTTVVRLTPRAAKYDLDDILHEFDTNYQPTFSDAVLLSDGQIRFISELLEDPSDQSKVEDSIKELAEKIKQKLNITTHLDNRTFLETIVKDYQYYASQGI